MDPKTLEVTPAPLLALPALPQPMPLLPQHVIISGTRKDCIRLRGLPHEAQLENILEFLGEHAKNIVFQGVHMVYTEGQPSGEAFIQMDCQLSAFITAQLKHHRYMFLGKNLHYIEVLQCSGDDMSMLLTGNYPAPAAVSPVAKTLLSPGMSLASATNTLAAAETSPTADAVPGAAAEAAYDLAVLQQDHAQIQQQQDIWLMNHLAPAQQQQQQQQTVAHNAAVAQQHAAPLYQQQQMLARPTASFVAENSAVPQLGAMWPPELVSNHAAVPPTSALLAHNNLKLATADAYPSVFPLHFPPPHPMFYIIIPPPQPQAAAAAVAAANLHQYAAGYQQYVATVPQPHQPYVAAAMSPPVAATAPVLNLKRSWDQAFPGNVGSATDANANLVKRQYGATAATSVNSSITAPVRQNHATYSMAGYPTTPAFYAPITQCLI